MKTALVVAVTGIAGFAFLNVRMLIWNLTELSKFKIAESYAKLRTTNAKPNCSPCRLRWL